MDIVKRRSVTILAVTVLLVLDIVLIPCLIIAMVVFSSYGFREFACFAVPFVLLIIITVFVVMLLSKAGYGKQEIDPYLFREGITSTQMRSMMKNGFAERNAHPVKDNVCLIIRRAASPDGFFLAYFEDPAGISPERFADCCVEAAIEQKLLPQKAHGFTDANFAFLFLAEHVHTNEIQAVLKRNASKRLFHFYAFLDRAGNLHVPAFWGSTSLWEKRYRNNLKYTLGLLEELSEQRESSMHAEDGPPY